MIDLKIGKRYSFEDYNCWDYAADIRSQANIKTKLFKPANMKDACKLISEQMQQLDHGLERVNDVRDFDILIVCKEMRGMTIYHCGVFYRGMVAHCSRVARQVVFESLRDFKYGYGDCIAWR